MSSFKEPGLAERQNAAANAKKTALKKFRAGADDPAFAQRRADRKVSAAERTAAKQARDIQKAEAKTREAELAKQAARDAAEKVARDLVEDAARGAERKAGRDARYAARKARKR
jgi:hypothetical protein